ncbi:MULTISPECIES: hypothetical protein [unclassified Stenotrophomonas]|uniref:hypothetical protein n=1 Tax=unclassified Stenotrophomonas TaxID=196198 RepID=UPI000D17DF4A|nr:MULTISPECIES: hypothetical protein [unclassified Stenotrophomonas]PTA73788.1 hypothetical protein C9412_03570 [Stenotrophomonas sp. Nf1]PTA82893.1 hypothetical protein C9416_03395 [Stenotrophomonas sp. Nf4]
MTAPQDLAQSAIYRHPSDSLFGRVLPRLLHAVQWTRLRRALSRRWPMPALLSDVRDVVYVSWWVDVRHAPPPPPGHHYVVHEGRTPYTILSYRHGHFGPALAGPLRALMPSPRQSNWRWYLRRDDDPEGTPVVLFDRNVMDQLAFVAGARAFSDAMQPHLSARFAHVLDADGAGHTVIESGQGSAPVLHLHWQAAAGWSVAGWSAAFGGDEALLRFLTCQDEAIARTCDHRWASTRIALPVAVDTLQPLHLSGELQCPRLQAMGVALESGLAFRLPRVPFRVVSERLL